MAVIMNHALSCVGEAKTDSKTERNKMEVKYFTVNRKENKALSLFREER